MNLQNFLDDALETFVEHHDLNRCAGAVVMTIPQMQELLRFVIKRMVGAIFPSKRRGFGVQAYSLDPALGTIGVTRLVKAHSPRKGISQ